MSNWTRVHPAALEQLRQRTGRPASAIIRHSGLTADRFKERLRDQRFTIADIQRLANALDVTPRDVLTTSTYYFTIDALHPH